MIDSIGASNSAAATATIANGPTANAGSPYTWTAGHALTLTGAKSTGPAGVTLTYAWSFGDGTSGTGVTPTHTYSTVGAYSISLTVTDSLGGSGTATTTATIIAQPIAAAGGPYNGAPGSAISFSGQTSTGPAGIILSYAWNFGDGTTGTGVAPTHTFTAVGTYNVSLTVTDNVGGSSTATAPVTVANGPLANPGGPYLGTANHSVSFSAAKSTVLSPQTLTYAWSFGDGGTGTGVTASHSYTKAGTYTVSLTATASGGGSNTATTSSTIDSPPIANPAGPYTGTVGSSLAFTGAASTAPAGQTLTYTWSFGDGSSGTGVTPSHTYAAAGVYTVSLTVTDSVNGSSTTGTKATIDAAPVAKVGGPYKGTTGVAVSLSGAGSTGPAGQTLTYAWAFGDGTSGTGVNPTHVYKASGTYTVSLTVSDSIGGSSTATVTATISSETVANAGGPYNGLPGTAISLSGSKSTGPSGQTLSYAWNFGDSSKRQRRKSYAHLHSSRCLHRHSHCHRRYRGYKHRDRQSHCICRARSPIRADLISERSRKRSPSTAASRPGPQGQTLTYAWVFGDSSTGSGATTTHAYTKAGTYTVSLTVSYSGGTANTATTTTTIDAETVASAGGPYNAAPGQAIGFSGSKSTGPAGQSLTYAWTFGDSASGSGVSPSHSYTTAGTYTVSLKVTDAIGGSSTASAIATVANTAIANPGGPYVGTQGQPVTFTGAKSTGPTGQTLTYTWMFGDGATGTGVSPTHSYTATGVFTVSVTVSITGGSSSNAKTTATISVAPVAKPGGPYNERPGQAIQFNGAASTFPAGQTLTYAWNFGDGSTATGVSPSHSFTTTGSYTASLTVTDTVGGTSKATTVVTIGNGPIANPAGPYTGSPSQSITFSGASSTGPSGQTLSYAWSFGDGSTATVVSPTHSYSTAGSYTVTLTVIDTIGGSNIATTTATISAASAPVANAGGPYTGITGQPVVFTGASSNAPSGQTLTYAWGFGDGGTGTGVSPSHSFTTTGTYTVSLTVKASGGGSSTATTKAIISAAAAPAITSFSPLSGSVGTVIKVAGANFVGAGGVGPQVTLTQQGGGTIAGPVSAFSASALSFVIPAGAATGIIHVAVGSQSAVSASSLTVSTSSTFSLAVTPSKGSLIQGQSTALSVTIASSNGFSGVAALSVKGLPAGVTATFTPTSIAVGQTGVLMLSAPATQAASTPTLTISGSATIQGQLVTQSATASLQISTVTTSFVGRTVVDDAQQEPIAGVTIAFAGKDDKGNTTTCTAHTTSDGGGNFQLTNLPSGCIGPQLISYNGATATSPAGKYAGVNLSYTLYAGVVVASPVLVHLPRIDNAATVEVQQNLPTDQVFNFPTIPGLNVTVYAGTTLTLDDGTQPNPFPLIAVEIPIDRLPDAIASSGMLNPFIVAFQPANAFASQPVAVNFPNVLNSAPGSHATFVTLDPTHGYMVSYGTGTVSSDGTTFVADPDKLHGGHGFGLVHFDWHGPMPPAPPDVGPSPDGGPPQDPDDGGPDDDPPNPDDPPDPPPTDSPSGCSTSSVDKPPAPPAGPVPVVSTAGDPVDLSSGIVAYTAHDIHIRGGRGSVGILRTYRTLSANSGPFGVGTSHNFSYVLNTLAFITNTSPIISMSIPNGNQFVFTQTPSGTFVNTTVPSLRGATLTVSGSLPLILCTLRYANGNQYVFTSFTPGSAYLTSIVDVKGNTTTIARNSSQAAQVLTVADAVGRTLTFAYDNSNRVIQITDPIGRAVRYTYNQTQNTLASVTDANGGITQYAYDALDNVISVTDARGVVVEQNTYQTFDGRVSQQSLADGGTYQFAYTLLNPGAPTSPVLQTVVTDPLGNQTAYRYNPQGFLVSVTDASGQTRVLNRDANHNNLVTSYTGSGVCASCGNTAAGDVSFTFDAIGNVLSQTNALGKVTAYTYDARFDKVTTITDALNHMTTISYDAQGDPLKITDANNHSTSMAYDSYGELTQITDPIGSITKIAYDGLGNATSVTNALGNVSKMTFDSVSRLIQRTDALGHSSSTGYDALNRVISQTDPRGNTTSYKFDAVGHLLAVTDARANTTSFVYDSVGRLQTRTSALGKAENYQYDKDSNLIQYTDRRGVVSKFQYDVLNRLVKETYIDATVTRGYDANGRLLAVNDTAGGIFGFSYDAAGRLISQEEPTGVVQYTRDALGRMSVRQVAGQAAVAYQYDPAGNLLSAAYPTAGVSYTYYSTNLPQTLTRTNGVATNYTFDKLGEVLSIVHAKGTTALNTLSYTYDSTGNRTAIGNNLSQALITLAGKATVDNGNQLLTNAGTTYTYDANGNRLTEHNSTAALTYVWDGRNRLSSITDGSENKTSMQYDFSRNLMVLSKTTGAATTTQSFVIDALTNVVSLTNASGAPVPVLTGTSIDSHFASVDPVAGVLFGIGDALGSNAGTTNSAGALGSTLKYEPYGQTTGTDAATFPFAFTGRVPILGNVNYFRNRYYDSGSARFISEDPLGFAGGSSNLYAYAGNTPLSKFDPTGTVTPGQVAGGIGAVGAVAAGAACVWLEPCGVVAWIGIYAGGIGGEVAMAPDDTFNPPATGPSTTPQEDPPSPAETWCKPGYCSDVPPPPPCPVGTCCPAYPNGNPL